MAKPKQPLLSLEAHGTIADSLTFQTRGRLDIARHKPTLPYFNTLPVQYQRWLYQDYAYLWTLQSAATQKAYRAGGVRFHLTGYQYWMKDMLTRLPDILGWWKLDDNRGATVVDSSRNTNTGTVFGAQPAAGAIDGCLRFDGVNDYINCGNHPSLTPGSEISIEATITPHSLQADNWPLSKAVAGPPWETYGIQFIAGRIRGLARTASGVAGANADAVYVNDTRYHCVYTYNGGHSHLYIDGIRQVNSTNQTPPILTTIQPLLIGSWSPGASRADATIDNVIIYNRPLDQTEVTRHAARRYPT